MLGMRRAAAGALALSAVLAGVALPSAAAGSALVVIVPVAIPAGPEGLVDADTLDRDTASGGVLARLLDAVSGTGATLAVDPMLIASIRALGSTAPASATAWLARLDALPNDVIPLPFSATDLTLATQAGAPSLPAPPDLTAVLDPLAFEGTTSTATPAPGGAALPTTAELTAWDWTATPVWPRANSVIASDLGILAGGGAAVVLASGNVTTVPATGIGAIGDVRVVVTDDTVSAALAGATTATSETWPGAMSALSVAIGAAGPRTVVASADPATGTAGRLGDTLAALGSTIVPLSSVLGAPAEPVTLVDEPQDPARVDVARRLLEAEAGDERFAAIAETPGAIVAPRRLQLLALLSQDWLGREAAWSARTDAYFADSAELRSSVRVVEASGFNLLADAASLPIAVSNDLDQTVTVYLTVRPATGLLAVTDPRVELVIPPRSQARGQVPVQAISNGSVAVTISLASADGVPVSTSTTAEINVQAGWETPIIVVLAAIVVATFGFGIVRNILRRRGGRPRAEES